MAVVGGGPPERARAWSAQRISSIEQAEEGLHHLEAEIVASPWSDSRVADEALVETAVADKLPEGFKPADLADLDFDGDARAAALDLSVADPRFAPDVLEAAARRAVEAWAQAVDGEDAPLEAVASPGAVSQLLHPVTLRAERGWWCAARACGRSESST